MRAIEAPGCVIWLTGLPASGKTTTASNLAMELRKKGFKVEILDGEKLRKNMSPELGFSKLDREIHGKRVAYISHLLSRNGIITIVALVSPYRSIRQDARSLIGNFVEVWVKCSIKTCYERDPKGIYKKAAQGQILNLTGVQDPYEPPATAEVIIDTERENEGVCIDKITSCLKDLEYI